MAVNATLRIRAIDKAAFQELCDLAEELSKGIKVLEMFDTTEEAPPGS